VQDVEAKTMARQGPREIPAATVARGWKSWCVGEVVGMDRIFGYRGKERLRTYQGVEGDEASRVAKSSGSRWSEDSEISRRSFAWAQARSVCIGNNVLMHGSAKNSSGRCAREWGGKCCRREGAGCSTAPQFDDACLQQCGLWRRNWTAWRQFLNGKKGEERGRARATNRGARIGGCCMGESGRGRRARGGSSMQRRKGRLQEEDDPDRGSHLSAVLEKNEKEKEKRERGTTGCWTAGPVQSGWPS
jgi:hypothetical protein